MIVCLISKVLGRKKTSNIISFQWLCDLYFYILVFNFWIADSFVCFILGVELYHVNENLLIQIAGTTSELYGFLGQYCKDRLWMILLLSNWICRKLEKKCVSQEVKSKKNIWTFSHEYFLQTILQSWRTCKKYLENQIVIF